MGVSDVDVQPFSPHRGQSLPFVCTNRSAKIKVAQSQHGRRFLGDLLKNMKYRDEFPVSVAVDMEYLAGSDAPTDEYTNLQCKFRKLSMTRIGLFLLVTLFLSACAQFGGMGNDNAAKPAEEKAAPVATPAPVAPAPVVAEKVNEDPHRIDFGQMTVALDDTAKTKIAALVAQAKTAKVVSVRGYCDRNKIGNAKEAALARAKAVKDELIRAGVPAKKIHVHFTTDKPDSSAVVSFDTND
jgi:hypothetical protein